MNRYYSVIVGEYVELGKIEIETLISIQTPIYDSEWIGRVFLFNAPRDPTGFIIDRAAHIREAGKVIIEVDSIQELYNIMRNISFDGWIGASQSFSVRHTNFANDERISAKTNLSAVVGKMIRDRTGAKVDLDFPDIRFQVVIMQDRVILCESKVSKLRGELIKRTPGRKPWFHPSMMNSIVARSMCNLAKVMAGDVVLDPFCGGGGILCEASIIGAKIIGVDLSWKFLKGAEVNLLDVNHSNFTLLQSDSREMPVIRCDHIVTDPPYGRVSSTRGEKAIQLLWDFLALLPSAISNKGTVCISASSEIGIGDMVDSLGYRKVCGVEIRVHSGLIREIIVIDF